MKAKITFLMFCLFCGISWVNAQFSSDRPDLRLCGSAPNYYLDYFNCTSNNYTLDDVFLSLTDVNGVPLNNTTCTPGVPETMYVMLNYTSNSNSNIYHTRMFADLIIDGVITQLNVNLGTVAPGSGQRLLYGPFTWICGQEMILDKILIVWRTNGDNNELVPYVCNSYNKAQCELPQGVVISAPLAVQFTYTGCSEGNQTTIYFDSTTNGGIPPYSFAWDFDSNGTTDSTQENPTFVYNNSVSNTATLTVTDSNGLTNSYVVVINYPTELQVSGQVTGLTCVDGSTGAIDLSVSGGNPPYTYSWSNGATTQDINNLTIGNYQVTVTDSIGCTKVANFSINPIVCCEFSVTCPTFQPITLECYDLLPSATTISIADFEALGNGDGNIGSNPCGVIEITASNSAYLGCNSEVIRTYTITEYEDTNNNGIRDLGENTVLNTTTCSQTIIINDTTAPTITISATDLTVECDGSGNVAELNAWLAANGGASASDSCSSVTWSNDFTSVSAACGATGSVTVTFTATDDCGNTESTSATFTIQDTTAPTITISATDLTVECDGSGNVAQLNAWLAANGGASASDSCSAVTWSNDFTSVSAACGATGSVTVTFTATDDCGNTESTSATFTIQDTTAPTITISATDLTVECDGSGNVAQLNAWLAANGGASASDSCSSVTWSNDFTSVSAACGATGSVTVTFTATDDCGNTESTSATFTIQDTTAPTITISATDLTVECDGSGNVAELNAWLAANGGASASDSCSSVTWSNDFTSVSAACGATGSVTVTFTATDDCGNSESTSATFTIQDTTAPTITISATDLTVECDGSGNVAELNAWLAANGGASASDSCSSVTWSNDFTSVSAACGATGSVTVTFTATDDCGNTESTSATFTIQDTTAPTITISATDLTVECDGSGNVAELNAWLAANGGASASDSCSSVTWSNDFTSVSAACGATGSVTVTFTATDDCGNTESTSATFTIQDTTAPTITISATDLTVECDGSGNVAELNAWLAANGGASASDSCSSVTWSNDFTSVSAACGATGSVTVTFTATDDCGNTESTSATFTIQDTTAPTITISATDLTVECDGSGNVAELNAWLAANGGASASDSCSAVTWSNDFTSVSAACGATGSVTVTFTATDDCGNTESTSATFTIQDTTAPTITISATDLTVECDGSGNVAELNAWLAANGGASASDSCSSVTWSNDFSAVANACGATGSVTVTFTATDECGNTESTSATFTIQDTTAPTITISATDLTVECDGSGNVAELNAWLAANGGASASDSCSAVTWSNDFTSVSAACGATGSVTVTFTATDDCGNTESTSATFTIQDTTAPTITISANDLTVECDGSGNVAQLNAWLASNGGATASDSCSSVTWSNDFTSVSAACGATGSVTVTFTATDDCGNTESTSATFTIQDTTAPTITISANDLTVECDGSGNVAELNAWLAANGGASASDSCSAVTWSNDFTSVSAACGATGSVTVTFTATDDCGNSESTSATFTIQDTTAPTITISANDLTVECDGSGNVAQLNAWLASNGGASASDSCSASYLE
jgi:large repetitive protein